MSFIKQFFTTTFLMISYLGFAQFQIPDTLEICPSDPTFEITMDFDASQSTILSQVSNATFTSLSLSDDFFSPLINIGFNFTFYGNTYSNCVISSNNFISFNSINANTSSVFTTNIPLGTNSPNDLKNTILAPFQDINPQTTGSIEYATIGTAPNRAFVARWYDIPMFNCTSLTFCSALIFYETTNVVETHLINKPNCSWQNGLAIHGLLNFNGTSSDIVYDADEMVTRNHGNQWTTTLEGTRFTPSGSSNYDISNIDFLPIVSLATSEYEDNLGNTYSAQQTTTINNVPGLTHIIASSSICSSSLIDTTYIIDLSTNILINGNNSNSINTCPAENVTLSVENASDFDSFLWDSGETTSSIIANTAGIHSVISTVNGCDLDDQITITNFSSYEIDLGGDIITCESQPADVDGTTANTSSYLWNDGITSPTRTISVSGEYILTTTSIDGCIDSDSIMISVFANPDVQLGEDSSLCNGESIEIGSEITGALYLWNTGETTSSITVDTESQYILTATIGDCSDSDTINIIFNPLPELDLDDTTSFCTGESVTINTSLTSPASYLWHDGSTLSSYTSSQTELAWVTVTSNNCSITDSIQIVEIPIPNFTLGNDTNLCVGDSIVLSVPYTNGIYDWNTTEITQAITIFDSGLYFVDYTENGCSFRDSISILFNPIPEINLGSDTIGCEGDSITFSATYPGSTYLWHNGSSSSTYTSTSSETVAVTVFLNNCNFTDSVSVNFYPQPAPNLGLDTILCEGEFLTLGSVISGASYLWNTGETSSTIQVSTTDDYWVKTNIGVCEASDTVSVIFNETPTINLGTNIDLCEGDSMVFNATYSTLSTYIWHDGSTNNQYTSHTSELVWVTVMLNNCSFTDSVEVDVHNYPIINLGNDIVACENDDITISVQENGATYLWNTGDTNQSISPTLSGDYSVQVTKSGCISLDTINIVYNPIPNINLGNDIDICEGDSTTLNAFYNIDATYLWQNGSTLPTYTSFQSELVWVIVTLDACTFTDSIIVTENPYPILELGPDQTHCQNDPVSLTVNENGASYLWNTGEITQSVSPSSTGLYFVEVEKNGCTVYDSIFIQFNEIPTINLGNNSTLCQGDSIVFNAFYNANSTYLWHDGSTNSTYTSLSSEMVWVTVTLENCSFTDSVQNTVFPYPEINLGSDIIACENDDIILSVSENNATYLWNTGAITQSISPIQSNTYTVEVTKNGCVSTDTISVLFNSVPTINLGTDIDICEGDSTILNAFYNSNSTYLWQNGSTQSTYKSFNTELAWVIVTLENCSFTDSLQITKHPFPILELGPDQILCEGDPLLLNVDENNASYLWNTGETTQSISPTISGLYFVEVEKNGCVVYDTVDILFNEVPIINLGNDTTICETDSVVFDAFYSQNSTYLWQDGSTDSKYTGTQTESISVEVTLGDCSYSSFVNLTVNPIPSISLEQIYDICEGDSIRIDAFYSSTANYLWSTSSTDNEETFSATGNYWVKVIENGCEFIADFKIQVHALPELTLNDIAICSGETEVVNAYNASIISYEWSTGENLVSIEIEEEGWYWVDLENVNCSVRDSFYLNVEMVPQYHLPLDTFLCENEPLILSVTSEGSTYLWNNGSTNSSISINDLGVYSVTVTNACGVRNDTVKVYPADCSCPVYAPNAINYSSLTGSGEFKFTTDCGEFIEFDLTIYNRWGKEIYHSTDKNKSWRPFEEEIINQDLYIYVLRYSLKEGPVLQKSGEIIIIH